MTQPSIFGLLSDLGIRISALAFSLFLTSASSLRAQPQLTQDPLMNLMLAQPQIDVDSPVTPVAGFDPPIIGPGQSATYWVKLNALEASIEWPDTIAAPGMSLRAGGHGQLLALANGKLQPHTTFNYHLRARQAGQYSVAGFTVTVYGKPVAIPAARLEVVTNLPDSPAPTAMVLEAPTTNLYVGQPVRLRVWLAESPGGMVQALGQVQFNGQGFIIDQSSIRQQLMPMRRPGSSAMVTAFVHESTLTAIATGTLSVFAQAFAVSSRFAGGIIIVSGPGQGGPGDYVLLDSEPLDLHVRPLPREGQLPGFTSAFSPLSLEPPNLATNVLRVGEPLKLTVKVHGDPGTSLARLVAPPAPAVNDWQVFSSDESTPSPVVQAQGFTIFTYTLVPLNPETRATPAIPFCCFDLQRGTYLDLTIQPVPVMVLPGSVAAEFRTIQKANASDSAIEKEPALTGLASAPGLTYASLVPVQRRVWFPLAQLAPAATFFGLWGWDRRRRYLELHPDIVRRRRARRALRRHRRALARAARNGDAAHFAAAAVDALRAACAPHFPAEPHALVGSDVVAVLPPDQRAGRGAEIVRRFFAVTDAAQFAPEGAQPKELLALRPELERLLDKLDHALEVPGEAGLSGAPWVPSVAEAGQPTRVVALLLLSLVAVLLPLHIALASSPVADALFHDGVDAYRAGDYLHATVAFREAATRRPAAGTLQNLGLAEWQQGKVGPAVLAWEQALWLDPLNQSVRANLRFARKAAQLEAPDLTWYEVASSWLPVNWWAWSAGVSLWLAVGMGVLPGIFRLRKAAWHQAVAALGLAVFLLSLPAHLGIDTRSRIGFVLQKDTPLRLTPTAESEFITHLAAGEPARLERVLGRYLLVRTSRTLGWLEQSQLGFVCPRNF